MRLSGTCAIVTGEDGRFFTGSTLAPDGGLLAY